MRKRLSRPSYSVSEPQDVLSVYKDTPRGMAALTSGGTLGTEKYLGPNLLALYCSPYHCRYKCVFAWHFRVCW